MYDCVLNRNVDMKYKVTLDLMVDPTKGDEVIKRSYTVEAKNVHEAYLKAASKQDTDIEEIRYKSIFNFNIEKIE